MLSGGSMQILMRICRLSAFVRSSLGERLEDGKKMNWNLLPGGWEDSH
jgi:hypothetical protein